MYPSTRTPNTVAVQRLLATELRNVGVARCAGRVGATKAAAEQKTGARVAACTDQTRINDSIGLRDFGNNFRLELFHGGHLRWCIRSLRTGRLVAGPCMLPGRMTHEGVTDGCTRTR